MLKKLRLIYENNRNIIKITKFTLISIFLLFLTWLIDYKYPGIKDNLPGILLLTPNVTSSFLSTLAGTFLTVTTFTFTTILTVLNKYSDSFTPRIVQDFIDKPNVLSLFGVFIGGFFYTVLSLFLIQNAESDDRFLSGTIAIFYAVAAMISFVLFVKRVLNDIKVSNVIENTYNHAHKLIEAESDSHNLSEKFNEDKYVKEIAIPASKSGYFYGISDVDLLGFLSGINCDLVIKNRIGEFVLKGSKIAGLYLAENPGLSQDELDELIIKLSDNLLINVKKNDIEDYHHDITNLVEIAMKGLSPGINDPNTAIEALRKVGILLGELFSSEHFYKILNEDEDSRIIYTGYSAKEELSLSFNQILHYGKSDPLVAEAILNSIQMIYLVSGETMHSGIMEFFNYCYNLCISAMDNEMYKERLKIIYDSFNEQ